MNTKLLQMLLVVAIAFGGGDVRAALFLGPMNITSHIGQPLSVYIQVHGSAGSVSVTAVDLAGHPMFVRGKASGGYIHVESRRIVQDPFLRLRVRAMQGDNVFAATYDAVVPNAGAVPVSVGMDRAYAGQMTTNSTFGWYGGRMRQQYGPTRPSQGLRNIARALTEEIDEPSEKIEVALYQMNRTHFIGRDPRRLKPHSMLIIPSTVDVDLVASARARQMDRYLRGEASTPHVMSSSAHDSARSGGTLSSRWRKLFRKFWPWIVVVTGGLICGVFAKRGIATGLSAWRTRRALMEWRENQLAQSKRDRQLLMDQIARLEHLISAHPEEVTHRIRLARSLLAVGDHNGFLRVVCALRAEVNSAQWKHFRALARSAGIRTPLLD